MKFLPAFLVALLNSMNDTGEIPEKVPVGPQTPEEIAQAREALLGKGDDEIFETVSPDAKFARMRSGKDRWPGYPGRGIVPYVISPELEEHRDLILKAMRQYHEKTCIKFVPRTTQHSYIKLVNDGEGCSSYIGRVGGMQSVSLAPGCHYIGTIVHELGHAIGLHHEQKRSDRDKYVYIFRNHIKENKLHNFKITNNIPEDVLSSPYNYDSIMHYGSYAFSKDKNNLITILAMNGQTLKEAYDKTGLNDGDVLNINKLYKCYKRIYRRF